MQPRTLGHVLKRVRFSPALFLCLLGLPAAAQTRWQGTLSQTQNGLTANAKIFAQAPDRLRVEIARNDAAGVSAQILVATGDQTLRYEPATKRLFRARFNILKKWNRDWHLAAGGPANFVFAEAKPGITTESEGRFLRRESVLFGGGGENAYYAAAKTPASLYAASVEIGPAQRLEKGVDGAQTLSATLTMKGDLPATATVTSAGETSVFNYDLTARAEPFPDATWTIDEAKSAVAQEIDVQAPTAYAGANDPNDLFNQGLALWSGAGDLIGAQTRFVAASKIASGASGPILASFEMSLEARDYSSAQKALDALVPLELDAAEIEARRARLALAQRDWDGALSALDKAVAAAPDSAALQLGRAQALLGKGDIEGARAAWQLAATAPALPALRAQAATLLAQTSDSNAADLADLAAAKQEAGLAALAKRAIGSEQTERNRRFALVLERAADDDNARVLWTELEARAPDDIKNQARAHLMTLAARAGDVAASLAAYGRLRDGLGLQSEREDATFALFDAWQKAFNRAALASAIANRAVATRADDGDARLALAYQETYGAAESIETAVNSGLARSPDSAFWLSRRAELTTQTAFPLLTSNNASAARRAQLLNKARDFITRAIASDVKAGGDGSFYREQMTLISAQSAAKVLRSPDISTVLGESKTASAAVETLLASAPDDPDVLVSAALALQSFDADDGARRALELAGRALLSKPGDGERHTLILAARQSMAFALVRLKRFPEAAAQFELLLLEARTAGEEVGIASNYIGMLEKTGDAQNAAGVVARIAGAPWDYAESRGALEALAARVALSPQVAPIEAALAREGSGAALLAWSQIAMARVARANAALQVPGAPGSADAEQERATRDLALAVDALKNAEGAKSAMPKHVEARVAVWLSEFGGLESEAALANLQRAVAIESRAPSLRLALADALPDDAQSAAQLQLARQLAPASLETARLLSVAALDAGASESALQGSAEAYNAAAREPNVGTNAFQRMAFARARILWEAGETSAAVDIYRGLALPQWADTDRAAALLALRERYTAANRPEDAARVSDRIREMGLDMPTLQRAARFVEDVEN